MMIYDIDYNCTLQLCCYHRIDSFAYVIDVIYKYRSILWRWWWRPLRRERQDHSRIQ